MTTTTLPVGTRVRPTTDPTRPGVITAHHTTAYGLGWVTVRHDNGQDLDWFTWALKEEA